MKPLTLIVATLCLVTIACFKETEKQDLGRRMMEARLVGAASEPCRIVPLGVDEVVQKVDCGERAPATDEACDELIATRDEAVRMLTLQLRCTDIAVRVLERTGTSNDLAVAYYTRAQRNDRPSDFLRALDAAQRAVDTAPESPEARFNVALAQEALGLFDDAITSWAEVLKYDRTEWAKEARSRRDRLVQKRTLIGPVQWDLNKKRLPAALRARDRALVDRLVAPFPATAQAWLEEHLLPLWAASPTQEHLEQVRLLAGVLSERTGDPLLNDAAEAVARATPEHRHLLQQGHTLLRDARSEQMEWKKAAALYRAAGRFLAQAGSPLHLIADLGAALNEDTSTPETFEALERAARAHRYSHFVNPLQSNHANALFYSGHPLEALDLYESVRATYERTHDPEGGAIVGIRKVGIIRVLGQNEEAWREIFRTQRLSPHIVTVQNRHLFLGEMANAARALGYPRIALLYQNAAVRLSVSEKGAHPAISLRERAAIYLDLGEFAHAQTDLTEAIRKTNEVTDARHRRALQARLEETRAQAAMLGGNLNGAVEAFSKARILAADNEYATFRSALLTQRAAALQRAGRVSEAERDLRSALDELRKEEENVLAGRTRGGYEELWSVYFSRFRQTYHSLIRNLVEQGHATEAFEYAERARAFEPLNLIVRVESVPKEIRELAGGVDAVQLQKALPRGTIIIQYSVHANRTYAWIVSGTVLQILELPAGQDDVERWTDDLHRAIHQRNRDRLNAYLEAPYDGLLSGPLRVAEKIRDRDVPARIVFVPDGAMHGLPFAALRNSMTKRHLVEETLFEIAGSTTLYLISLARDRALRASDTSTLLIGNPNFDETASFARGLKPLPGAETEVREIGELYGADAEILTGDAATIPAFLTLARNRAIVQFAGHSIVNRGAPYLSMLVLAPSPGHSGALQARELLTRLELDKTRLVVLSSCSSAEGRTVGLEGVGPLVRPLVAAGVPAIVGSLWDVDDATTRTLLVSFHRHYQQGKDAASALRAAQRELLKDKNPGLASVFAWGSFQVIGHASSPFGPPADEKEKPP